MKMMSLLIGSALVLFTTITHAQVTDAKALYQNYCSVCHGDNGDGKSHARQGMTPPPRDFTSQESARLLSQQRIELAIREGVAGTAMTGWKSRLSNDQITMVADYVISQFLPDSIMSSVIASEDKSSTSNISSHNHSSHSPTLIDMSEPFADSITGDLARGEILYIKNCVTCHGEQGDGRGPRAYFINPKPRNFLHSNSRASLNRPALFNAVSKGKLRSEMSAWDKVFGAQQIVDVSEYVFSTFINP